jgi:hypothetical protein
MFYLVAFAVMALLTVLLSLLIWLTRRSDRTVIDRMNSASRVDGRNDPRAHLHHSSY